MYVKGRSSSSSLTKQDLDALKTSVAAIEEAYRLLQKQGARLIVVFAPTAFRVYHDIARFRARCGENITPPWNLDDLPDRLRKMIATISSDIGYLDLTSALKTAAKEHKLVFLSDDTHWSFEGHRVVAEALAEALKVETKSDADGAIFRATKKHEGGYAPVQRRHHDPQCRWHDPVLEWRGSKIVWMGSSRCPGKNIS